MVILGRKKVWGKGNIWKGKIILTIAIFYARRHRHDRHIVSHKILENLEACVN